jgi:diacylglycerol kinase (ATP)
VTRVLLVFNPASGRADEELQERIRKEIASLGEISVAAPPQDDVRRSGAGSDIVVVAGGDGTLNRTLGDLAGRLSTLTLGLVPMGTGNDFSRTLGVPNDPVDAARSLATAEVRQIDVGRASGGKVEHLFLNACMGGFPVEVDEATDEKVKKRLGPLAFWIGGAKALTDLTPSVVTVNGRRLDGCIAAGVGNGRTCGGGMEVWPSAHPGDGALDACALAIRNPAQGALLAARVRSGKHEDLDEVLTERSPSITIEADPPIEFNVDGELVGLRSPATFEIVGQVEFLVPRSAPNP